MGSSVLLVFLIPFLLPRIIKLLITDGPEFLDILAKFDWSTAFDYILETGLPDFIDELFAYFTTISI